MDYFDYTTQPELAPEFSPEEFDVEAFLERSQEQERQRLEKELTRIEKQLEARERIHRDTIEELESKLDWYLEQLETLYQQHRGKQGRRSEVKSRIKQFYRDIREEKQNHWSDRQDLVQEQRTLRGNLDELLSRDQLTELL